jgi:hypothetical protein
MAKSSVSKASNLVSSTNVSERAGTKERAKTDPAALTRFPETAAKEPAKPPASAAPIGAGPVVADLAISAIRLDGGTQARVKLSTATITEYATAMREGAKFPPPVVFCDGGVYWPGGWLPPRERVPRSGAHARRM